MGCRVRLAVAVLCAGVVSAAAAVSARADGLREIDLWPEWVLDPAAELDRGDIGPPTFFLRGVGVADPRHHTTTGVTVLRDGSPIEIPLFQLAALHDLGEIEVQRGPRTGRIAGASAGVLRADSAAPEPGLAVGTRLSVGNFSAQDYEGYVNLPLHGDWLLSRVSFRFRDRAGLFENVCGDAGPLLDRPPSAAPTNRSVPGALKGTCGEDRPDLLPDDLDDEPYDRHVWSGRILLRALPRIAGRKVDVTFGLTGDFRDQGDLVPASIPTGSSPSVRDPSFPPGEILSRRTGFLGTGSYISKEINEEYFRLAELAAIVVPPGTPQRQAGINDIVVPALNERLGRRGDREPFSIGINRESTIEQNAWTIFLHSQAELRKRIAFEQTHSFVDTWRRRETDDDGTPNRAFESIRRDTNWQQFHDVALTGSGAGETPGLDSLRWRIGLQLLQARSEFDREYFFRGLQNRVDGRDEHRRVGPYGELGFELGGIAFDLAARLDRMQRDVSYVDVLVGAATNFVLQQAARHTETLPAWSLDFSAEPWPQLRLWGRYARANKDPEAELRLGFGTEEGGLDLAPAERTDGWEAGFASRALEGRVGLSGRVFFNVIRNRHLLFVEPEGFAELPDYRLDVARRAQSYGADVALFLRPLRGLDLSVRFEWLEATLTEYRREILFDFDISSPFGTFPAVEDLSGSRAPNSPRFSIDFAAEYVLDLGRFGLLVPRYQLRWRDDVHFDAYEGRGRLNPQGRNNLPDLAVGQRAFVLHDLRLAFRTANGRLELAGWVRNLTDEVWRTGGFSAPRTALVLNLAEPRTFGAELRVRLD